MGVISQAEQTAIKTMVSEALHTYRDLLAGSLGHKTYGGDRDYYRILGYKSQLTLHDYYERYARGDIAARIVDLPAQDTWRRPPKISENDALDTPFVRAWEALVERLHVWALLARVDRLAGLGHYGVLLLGVAGGNLATPLRTASGPEALRYLRPFAELHAEIESVDTDPLSPRYQMPLFYRLRLETPHGGTAEQTVHWSRVIHVADNKLDSEVYGVPRLKKVWNRLDDLMKLTGGAAEATWLNMRRGTVFTTQEGYRLDGDEAAVDDRQEMIRQYVHDMARILVLEGLEVGDLGSSTVDPRGAYDVALSQLSAAVGIPQRVLVGSAQGELAAAEQDTKIWYDQVASRQKNWAEPDVLRPFIDRLIEYGLLPAPPQGYDIGELDDNGVRQWPSLWQVSEVEAAAISMNRGQAVAAMRNPVTGNIPITQGELRQIVGLPYRLPEPDQPEDEVETPPLPTVVLPAEAEAEAESTDSADSASADAAEPPQENMSLETALENYARGAITAKQLARYAALAWAAAGRRP